MKKAIVVIAILVVLLTTWIGFNPIGKFGFCRFGLLVYSAIPFPGVDLVIHVNGLPALRGSKTHWKLSANLDRGLTKVARMLPSLLGGGMVSGGLGAAAPNTIIPLGMPPSLLGGGLL